MSSAVDRSVCTLRRVRMPDIEAQRTSEDVRGDAGNMAADVVTIRRVCAESVAALDVVIRQGGVRSITARTSSSARLASAASRREGLGHARRRGAGLDEGAGGHRGRSRGGDRRQRRTPAELGPGGGRLEVGHPVPGGRRARRFEDCPCPRQRHRPCPRARVSRYGVRVPWLRGPPSPSALSRASPLLPPPVSAGSTEPNAADLRPPALFTKELRDCFRSLRSR